MGSNETFKIFCGNLSPLTTGSDLCSLFSKYGEVIEADVITGKNFGFVHMSTEKEGINALRVLQGYLLNGEKMVVQRAISSKKASSLSNNYAPMKRNIIGEGIQSLDDFELAPRFEVNDNYSILNEEASVPPKEPTLPSSPVNLSYPMNTNTASERPSPVLLSSAPSTSYTPEHIQHQRQEQTINHLENLVISQDEKSLCLMCSETYDSCIHLPKTLNCKHTFCLDCIMSLTKGFEIRCPLGCAYITLTYDLGIPGLTPNQTETIKQNTNADIRDSHCFDANVCCDCVSLSPGTLCILQKHRICKESEAVRILKPQLQQDLEFAVRNLRHVMELQATLKERMQYTLHSLNKFSEELKLKIEGEELEQKIQQSLLESLLGDLHEMNDAVMSLSSISELIQKLCKVRGSRQNITSKHIQCFAKDAVNGALQSIVLELREPLEELSLAQLGFSAKEAFSLASSLKDNADRGNFANVLLIYLLSDLLLTRYRPPTLNAPIGLIPFSSSFSPPPLASLSPAKVSEPEVQDELFVGDQSKMFDVDAVIDSSHGAEATLLVADEAEELGLLDSHPSHVSSPLSLGLLNFSLLDHHSPYEDEANNNKESDKETMSPRPVSYLDAVKKPAKQQDSDSQLKQMAKSAPLPIKPSTKFPHCWMVISINGTTVGRIIFQLRPDKAPTMCDNFIGLCTGRSGYGYKGTHFFKNGDGFLVGGDVENDDGTGGYSVFGKQKFEADLCPLKDGVGMVRFKGVGTSDKGRGMVGSQFMIWYTNREFKKFSFSLVFGKVVDGLDIVQQAANCNLYKDAVKVEECGAI